MNDDEAHLPPEMADRFTSLFIAAKLGILTGSLCSAMVGILLLAWLTSHRRTG